MTGELPTFADPREERAFVLGMHTGALLMLKGLGAPERCDHLLPNGKNTKMATKRWPKPTPSTGPVLRYD